MRRVWKFGSNACEANGEPLEEEDSFKYLGPQVASDGGCERDVVHRMNEGCIERGECGKLCLTIEVWR